MNSDSFLEVKNKIQREMVESGVPSFAVAVAHGREIL